LLPELTTFRLTSKFVYNASNGLNMVWNGTSLYYKICQAFPIDWDTPDLLPCSQPSMSYLTKLYVNFCFTILW